MSLIYRYGLQGEARNPEAADFWRERALTANGSTLLTTFMPGTNGESGQISSVHLPGQGDALVNADLVERCAESLNSENLSESAVKACGGEALALRLRGQWAAARIN